MTFKDRHQRTVKFKFNSEDKLTFKYDRISGGCQRNDTSEEIIEIDNLTFKDYTGEEIIEVRELLGGKAVGRLELPLHNQAHHGRRLGIHT